MEIKEIKSRLSIITVLEHYGLRMNRNKMICCPFHNDKNPSMQVYPKTNTVFCFSGNCAKNGKAIDTIQFIQDRENISKHEAILKAQTLIGAITQQSISKPIIQSENLIMKNYKRNKILGIIAICINSLLVLDSFYWLYAYNFTPTLWLIMYPIWVLLLNALLGIVGIYVSILLFKNRIGIKLFLIVTLALWLFTLSNYCFPIY